MAQKIANATREDRRGRWALKSTMKVVLVGAQYNRGGLQGPYDPESKTYTKYPRIIDTKRGVGGLWLV